MRRAIVEIQRDPVSLGFLPSLTLLLLILLPVGATAGDEIHSTDRSGQNGKEYNSFFHLLNEACHLVGLHQSESSIIVEQENPHENKN
jgi:hypothetical protein